jgi:deoxyribodipyrimidine photolyase-related protein
MTIAVWILGDQLLACHPALAPYQEDKARVRVVILESQARLRRLPYHRKKLVLLVSAMRHYAGYLRANGWQVDYRIAADALSGLKAQVAEQRPEWLETMAASEYRGRLFQHSLPERLGIPIRVLANTQFLSGRYDPFPDAGGKQRVVMENYYRRMRRHFRLLMSEDGEPIGGQWNYDAQNRKPLPKEIVAPAFQRFEADEITRQVMLEIEQAGVGTGEASGFDLAVTHAQAQQALQNFLDHRLGLFGAYEDAMSAEQAVLFHSRLSPYLNLGLLEPLDVARQAEERYLMGNAPINSVEGFIRQVVGWREYIYWQYWRLMPDLERQNFWQAQRRLPEFFWNGETQMDCLRHAIQRALKDGYTHHIERLMVVANFCLLAGVDPQEVNAWFLSSFVDAYEWVMAPNVFGMGLQADGGMVGTKPYIASANYINKMSDYCQGCIFDHRQRTGADACPFNYLYWNFLIEHESQLRANPRMGPNVLGLSRLDGDERRRIQAAAQQFLEALE